MPLTFTDSGDIENVSDLEVVSSTVANRPHDKLKTRTEELQTYLVGSNNGNEGIEGLIKADRSVSVSAVGGYMVWTGLSSVWASAATYNGRLNFGTEAGAGPGVLRINQPGSAWDFDLGFNELAAYWSSSIQLSDGDVFFVVFSTLAARVAVSGSPASPVSILNSDLSHGATHGPYDIPIGKVIDGNFVFAGTGNYLLPGRTGTPQEGMYKNVRIGLRSLRPSVGSTPLVITTVGSTGSEEIMKLSLGALSHWENAWASGGFDGLVNSAAATAGTLSTGDDTPYGSVSYSVDLAPYLQDGRSYKELRFWYKLPIYAANTQMGVTTTLVKQKAPTGGTQILQPSITPGSIATTSTGEISSAYNAFNPPGVAVSDWTEFVRSLPGATSVLQGVDLAEYSYTLKLTFALDSTNQNWTVNNAGNTITVGSAQDNQLWLTNMIAID